jgi:hypothetical protein
MGVSAYRRFGVSAFRRGAELPASFLSIFLFDAIWPNGVVGPFSIGSVNRCDTLENSGVVRERYFFNSLLPSMDCFGTRKEKYHPDRFLGVQRPGQCSCFELFCYLSAGFGRGTDDTGALALIRQEPLLEMARGFGGKKGQKVIRYVGKIPDRGQIVAAR